MRLRPFGLINIQQHDADDGSQAEGRRLAIPRLRQLPHQEPFAADGHEPGKPEEDAQRQAKDRQPLDLSEALCVPDRPEQTKPTSPAKQRDPPPRLR